ncbi:MAG: hypothetical protein L6V79_07180 [Clostridium sp.]|nr:MAG: hypothetical protein L6V79_07180 [Clostridium sp.]
MEVRNLSFQYHNSRTIFSDVNFDIDQGEVLSIIGINGAGKINPSELSCRFVQSENGRNIFGR